MADQQDICAIHIDGLPQNGKEIRLSVFVKKADMFRVTLQDADRELSGPLGATVDFVIADLRKDNPCTIAIYERPLILVDERTMSAFDYVTDVVRRVTAGDRVTSVPYSLLEHLQGFVEGFGKKYSRLWFTKNNEEVAVVTYTTVKALEQLLANTITSTGSISGRVEKYNSHGDEKNFYIYPALGGKVKCIFPDELIPKAAAAVEQFVTVHGTLRHRVGEYLPFELLVAEIEGPISPDDVPKFADLYGAAPNATGDKSAADFIRDNRDWDRDDDRTH